MQPKFNVQHSFLLSASFLSPTSSYNRNMFSSWSAVSRKCTTTAFAMTGVIDLTLSPLPEEECPLPVRSICLNLFRKTLYRIPPLFAEDGRGLRTGNISKWQIVSRESILLPAELIPLPEEANRSRPMIRCIPCCWRTMTPDWLESHMWQYTRGGGSLIKDCRKYLSSYYHMIS